MNISKPLPTLYVHPRCPASWQVMRFALEAAGALEVRVIDLHAAEQAGPEGEAFSLAQPLPVLVDGHRRLTEASAILKYLADPAGAGGDPHAPPQRARGDELGERIPGGPGPGLGREPAGGRVGPLAAIASIKPTPALAMTPVLT